MDVEISNELFRVETTSDGSYFAVRSVSPMFCLHGESVREVVEKALSAFESYDELVNKAKDFLDEKYNS